MWFGRGTEGMTGQVKLVLNTHIVQTYIQTDRQAGRQAGREAGADTHKADITDKLHCRALKHGRVTAV